MPFLFRNQCALVFCLAVTTAQASDPGLDIADVLGKTAPTLAAPATSQRRLFVETSVSTISQARGPIRATRASIDYFEQRGFVSGLHGVISGRLDNSWQTTPDNTSFKIHTLRELLLEWQSSPNWVVDAGRINAQFGEAVAFNPTDFFREGSLRSVTSAVPADLRDNRQGSVMARAQRLWNGGAITVIGSPRVSGRPSSDTFSLDLPATNSRNRWLVALSQKLGEEITPQLFIMGGGMQQPQVGLSLSWLPLPGVVTYVEASSTQRLSTLASIGAWPNDYRQRPQFAIGGTWSATDTLSFNLEFDEDTTAPDAAQIRVLENAVPALRAKFLEEVQRSQNLSYRRQWFGSVTWKDLYGTGINLSALARVDASSWRGRYWLEMRKRFGSTELASQLLFKQRAVFEVSGAETTEISIILKHCF